MMTFDMHSRVLPFSTADRTLDNSCPVASTKDRPAQVNVTLVLGVTGTRTPGWLGAALRARHPPARRAVCFSSTEGVKWWACVFVSRTWRFENIHSRELFHLERPWFFSFLFQAHIYPTENQTVFLAGVFVHGTWHILNIDCLFGGVRLPLDKFMTKDVHTSQNV